MPAGSVSQRVERSAVLDLVEAPPRGALAFATDDGPQCLPVSVRSVGGETIVDLDPRMLPSGDPPDHGVLLVDDGWYWFELRALVRRGRLRPIHRPGEQPDETVASFVLDPTHEVAWDYGTLHEEPRT